ncbi:hypothetical protein MPSEU_000425400 [Mayamaea pseudoterrestris]|nr:hypothetical protein MPSEU_000425400 [Mayamaea pseudoterrestris]
MLATSNRATAPPSQMNECHRNTQGLAKAAPFKMYLSVSCISSMLMAVYVAMAMFNLYRLMFPLATLDLSPYASDQFVKPLWSKGTPVHLRVYLSSRSSFDVAFLNESFKEEQDSRDVELLWDERVDESTPSFTKSFLLTTSSCQNKSVCQDESLNAAIAWLDQMEGQAADGEEAGVLSVVSGAGQGIESTSLLLNLYLSAAKHVRSLFHCTGLASKEDVTYGKEKSTQALLRDRATIHLEGHSPIWSALQHNTSIYAHVVLLRHDLVGHWPPSNFDEAREKIGTASRSHGLLLGSGKLVKWELPDHVKPPSRVLYHDVVYIFRRYILHRTRDQPPWDMEYAKADEFARYVEAQRMKRRGMGYAYWKPLVSAKYINDLVEYPMDLVHLSGMPLVQLRPSNQHPTGVTFTPAIYVDEIGMTSEKYIPINETVTSLPLRISFDRSDIERVLNTESATAGGISPARWRLLSHLSQAIESQKALGFDESDIDDVRRLIADTNVTLLTITMLASALHLLFEFLTFKSEVSFWNTNSDLTGLSVRSLFLDAMGQTVILLYLIERESSLLITVPSGIGLLIAMWKCQRASGLRLSKISEDRTRTSSTSWWNKIPSLFGFEFRALRLDEMESRKCDRSSSKPDREYMHELTIQSDRLATRTLGAALFPAVFTYAIYSVMTQKYTGWYSWIVTTASSAVYTLGFVLMTPQLFLNYRLKSVAHLPWRVLAYKFVNTFIDDLFSFIIRMPTLARIGCFRDDIVFFVYLYQRWLYPVDVSRPVEGISEGMNEARPPNVTESKKRQ